MGTTSFVPLFGHLISWSRLWQSITLGQTAGKALSKHHKVVNVCVFMRVFGLSKLSMVSQAPHTQLLLWDCIARDIHSLFIGYQ